MNNPKYGSIRPVQTGGAIDYTDPGYSLSAATDLASTNTGSFSSKQYPQSPLSHNDGRPYRWFIRGDITERPEPDGNRAV